MDVGAKKDRSLPHSAHGPSRLTVQAFLQLLYHEGIPARHGGQASPFSVYHPSECSTHDTVLPGTRLLFYALMSSEARRVFAEMDEAYKARR